MDVVNLDAHVVNIAKGKLILLEYMRHRKPVFLWSSPGIGKTTIVNDVAREYIWKDSGDKEHVGMPLIYFHAALREPVDLRGLPYLDETRRLVEWFAPAELPTIEKDGEEGILFFDEYNTASPTMQAATMRLILEGAIGDYQMPPKWHRIAAGNNLSDRACAQKMPTALANRFKHIEIIHDLDAFTTYAIRKGISDRIIAFLRVRPNLLHDMRGANLKAWPSPRSWEEAAAYVDYPDSMRQYLMSGAVGFEASNEYESFTKVYADIPTIEEIVKNPKRAKVPTNSSACYAVITQLAARVNAKTLPPVIDYIERFEDESTADFIVIFCYDAAGHHKELLMETVFQDRLIKRMSNIIPNIG